MIGNRKGKLGEDIAERFLRGKGHTIIHKNYWKPYGEIDIVSEKENKLYFIEVKSVSTIPSNVSCENIRPEENIHEAKLRKIGRVIEVFLSQAKYKNTDWQFDVVIVYFDEGTKKAEVKVLENQILEGR